jgi:hypothetical protein
MPALLLSPTLGYAIITNTTTATPHSFYNIPDTPFQTNSCLNIPLQYNVTMMIKQQFLLGYAEAHNVWVHKRLMTTIPANPGPAFTSGYNQGLTDPKYGILNYEC